MEASLFIDFDGTISPVDISNRFFRAFAGEDAETAIDEWKAGKISSVECLQRELAAFRGDISELARFARRQPIDPGFHSLLEECTDIGVDVFVVSDGLDYYIRAFLQEHGCAIEFYANVLEVVDGKPSLKFPFFNEACGKCANCKSGHVEAEKRKGKRIVYVGDGLSDKCAAAKADLVFAKGDLKSYCIANDIPFEEFRSLEDVAKRIRPALEHLHRSTI